MYGHATTFLLVQKVVLVVITCNMNTDANVVITTDERPCVCGKSLTLTCKFTKYTDTISWMNENDVIPIAKCLKISCYTNPKYDQQYNFTSDLNQHIFNLTIIAVTMNDNGRNLVCSDGSNTDSWRILVKEYEPRLIEETEIDSITVLSGCCSQDVTFKWMKIDSSGESELKPNKREGNTESCAYNSGCGSIPRKDYSEKIYVKASANGKFFLRCIVIYGNESKQSVKSSKRYAIDGERNVNNSTNPVLTIISVGVVTFILISVLIFFFYCLLKRKNRMRNRDVEYHLNGNLGNSHNGCRVNDQKADEKEKLIQPIEKAQSPHVSGEGVNQIRRRLGSQSRSEPCRMHDTKIKPILQRMESC